MIEKRCWNDHHWGLTLSFRMILKLPTGWPTKKNNNNNEYIWITRNRKTSDALKYPPPCRIINNSYYIVLKTSQSGYIFLSTSGVEEALVNWQPTAYFANSGAGTNSKVWGDTCPLLVPLHFVWLHKYNYSFWWALSWLTEHFGQFIVCCSFTHGAPSAQPFVKVAARAPRALWSRHHCPPALFNKDVYSPWR